MTAFTLSETVLGHPIWVCAAPLDDGWDVSVTGGCRTHVGAVSLAAPGEAAGTLQRPGHRDAAVAERWAAALAEAWHAPVCVRCGIHYHAASQSDIAAILAACDRLLERLLPLACRGPG